MLTLVNISKKYGRQTAVENINLTMENGLYGMLAPNGAGKTTIIKLLCRLYEPTQGKITLNGMDIQTIPITQYHELIGIVLQDYALFAYSIKENIIFDKSYNEIQLKKSIQQSGLSKKIDTLPNGIETSVYKILDDYGIEFSGGEGQKLALARALYKNPAFLILDEPTSALDPIAEYELFSSLSQISEGKTTFFISHRLSSTKFCDRIIVIDNGTICETGSHDELMKRQGIYADLFSTQAKYYRKEQ